MTRRANHYEAAFEDFVRSRGWPYVPVNEQRKAIFAGGKVKSFDFLVYRPEGRAWIVDLKGRKFPYDLETGQRYWENWVTRTDLDSLGRWGEVFGDGFDSVFVFAYWLTNTAGKLPSASLHSFRDHSYAFLWIPTATYAQYARPRSAAWDTVSMPSKKFRELLRPATPG